MNNLKQDIGNYKLLTAFVIIFTAAALAVASMIVGVV